MHFINFRGEMHSIRSVYSKIQIEIWTFCNLIQQNWMGKKSGLHTKVYYEGLGVYLLPNWNYHAFSNITIMSNILCSASNDILSLNRRGSTINGVVLKQFQYSIYFVQYNVPPMIHVSPE